MNYKFALLSLAAIAILLTGCERQDNVKNANNETPVRYVNCGANESDCFVVARFKTIQNCETHRKWAAMHCDRLSKPGTMVCTEPPQGKQFVFTFCTM